MNRIICIIFFFVSSAIGAFAQNLKPYNKKETKEFIENVKELMSLQEYEQSIFLVESTSDRIILKNIDKTNRNWWIGTQSELSVIREKFETNEKCVNEAWDLYNKKEYWRCNEAVSALHLDKTCANSETLKKLSNLDNKLNNIRSKIADIESKLPYYVDLYNDSQFEKLLPIAKEEYFLMYINPAYLDVAEVLFSYASKAATVYEHIMQETVINPENELPWGRFEQLGYKVSNLQLSAIEQYIENIKSLNYDKNSFPQLASKQKSMLARLEDARLLLTKRISSLNPKIAVMGGNPVTYSQVKEDCEYIDSDLRSILSLDVCSYFDKSFSSDLQKEVFMNSDEYKHLLAILKERKNVVQNTVYAYSYEVNTGKYVIDQGSFYLEIGNNKGMNIPFINVLKGDHSHAVGGDDKVVIEPLQVSTYYWSNYVRYFVDGDSYHIYKVKVPIPKATAINFENKDCELIICFTPQAVKRYEFTVTEVDGVKMRCYPFNMWKMYPYATTCRVLLYTKDKELIFDQIYK